jgi:hypothetical protein
MDNLPLLLQAAMVEPCGKTGTERCRECITCAARWIGEQGARESARRSDEGRRAHFAIKLWIQFGCRPDFEPEMDDEIRPYFRQFVRFFLDHGLTAQDVIMSEVTVLNRAHGCAGTLDIGVRVRASASWRAAELVAMLTGWPNGEVTVLVDVKTREKEDDLFTQDMALQLAGYRNAETIMYEDGAEVPMPATDGGVIVQLHPDSYSRRPVDTGPETYAAFLVHLEAVRWQWEEGGKVAGVRRFPLPDELKVNGSGDFPTVEAALKRILAEHPDRRPAVKAMRARIKAERTAAETPGTSPAPAPRRRTSKTTAASRPAAADTTPATGKQSAKTAPKRRSVTSKVDPFALTGRARELADEDIPF